MQTAPDEVATGHALCAHVAPTRGHCPPFAQSHVKLTFREIGSMTGTHFCEPVSVLTADAFGVMYSSSEAGSQLHRKRSPGAEQYERRSTSHASPPHHGCARPATCVRPSHAHDQVYGATVDWTHCPFPPHTAPFAPSGHSDASHASPNRPEGHTHLKNSDSSHVALLNDGEPVVHTDSVATVPPLDTHCAAHSTAAGATLRALHCPAVPEYA